MAETCVLLEHPAEGVSLLRLNRPDKMNALNSDLVGDLLEGLATVDSDPACRVLILTGAGRGFCAGADLAGYGVPRRCSATQELQVNQAVQEELAEATLAITSLKVPVIAAVNGPAAGGGMALAVAADLRVVSTTASFSVAFVKVGLSGCDLGLSWLLPRAVGIGLAFELMLTGRKVTAEEAGRIGLANRVVEPDALLEQTLALAGEISTNSPWGVRMTKQVMRAQLEVGSLRAAMELENRTQVLSTYTGDIAEASAAFAERRAPRWA